MSKEKRLVKIYRRTDGQPIVVRSEATKKLSCVEWRKLFLVERRAFKKMQKQVA